MGAWTLAITLTASVALTGCADAAPGTAAAPGAAASPPGPSSAPAGPAETAPPPDETSEGGTDDERHGLPSEQELAQARQDVGRLESRRLAAQLVVVRQPGPAAKAAAAPVRGLGVGGVTAFATSVPKDVPSIPRTVRAANAAVQRAMRESGRDWPAFIAIDQEGGPVTRIGPPLTQWPAAMALGAARDGGLAREVARASGAELRGLGYTAVLAPVADVTIGPADPTIGARSPGSSPEAVTAVAGSQVAGFLQAGVLPVVKHFPGHGGVRGDSHQGAVHQPASRTDLDRRGLRPFRELTRAGVPAVMTGHIVLDAVDRKVPATLSGPVVDGLLRREWGYRGLVVTDALEMAAVTRKHGPGEAAVRAVLAGNDVLLMPADAAKAIDAVAAAVASGRVPRERLVESAARMVATLRHVNSTTAPADQSPPGSHAQVARKLAAASVTVLGGRCGTSLVGRSIKIVGGSSSDRAALTRAARDAGLATSGGTTVALLGSGTYRAAEAGRQATQRVTGEVVVALDTPYGLASHPRAKARIAAYGRTPETFGAVVDVLLGRTAATGRLPVSAGPWKAGTGCDG